MQKQISATAIDKCLWEIKWYLMRKYTTQEAERDVEPLHWYITTGRAPSDFLRSLINAKPFMIARKLHNAGTYDESIETIKSYLMRAGR